MEKDPITGQREELLIQTRRLASIFLERIETGVKDGSLDQTQIRMIGSLALRSLRLWRETLGKRDAKKERIESLTARLADTEEA